MQVEGAGLFISQMARESFLLNLMCKITEVIKV